MALIIVAIDVPAMRVPIDVPAMRVDGWRLMTEFHVMMAQAHERHHGLANEDRATNHGADDEYRTHDKIPEVDSKIRLRS